MNISHEPQVVLQGTLADPSGLNPEGMPPSVRAQFDAVRARYDAALQVTRITPYQPQADERTPAAYERRLLAQLTAHTQHFQAHEPRLLSDSALAEYRSRIIAEALAEPHRLGELRAVQIVDRAGRKCTEFHGPKRLWMSAHMRSPEVSPIYEPADPTIGKPARALRIPG